MPDVTVAEYTPSNLKLRTLLQVIWSFETGTSTSMPEVIAPDGQVEFVFFAYGTGSVRIHGCDPIVRQPQAFAYTQLSGCLEIAISGPAAFMSFRTNLAVAQTLLGFPATEAPDTCLDLNEVWPHELPSFLCAFRKLSWTDRLTALEQFVCRLLVDADSELQRSVWLYDWMLARGHALPIPALASKIGHSRRTLERRFRQAGGASPIAIANIGRFLRACHLLRARPNQDIAQIAQELGYSDQPHFCHQFKHYTLMSPSQFRQLSHTGMVDPDALPTLAEWRG